MVARPAGLSAISRVRPECVIGPLAERYRLVATFFFLGSRVQDATRHGHGRECDQLSQSHPTAYKRILLSRQSIGRINALFPGPTRLLWSAGLAESTLQRGVDLNRSPPSRGIAHTPVRFSDAFRSAGRASPCRAHQRIAGVHGGVGSDLPLHSPRMRRGDQLEHRSIAPTVLARLRSWENADKHSTVPPYAGHSEKNRRLTIAWARSPVGS